MYSTSVIFRRCFLISALLCGLSGAHALTVTLEQGVAGYAGATDASLYHNYADNSNGGQEFIYAGVTQHPSPRRALIRFDVSTLPQGLAVQQVELRLIVERSRPGIETYKLHRVVSSWGEGNTRSTDPGAGGFGAPAAAGDATWNSRFHGTTSWINAGGDFAAAASATTSIENAGAVANFSSAGLVTDVQSWIQNSSSNNGWILIGNEAVAGNARRFHSSEGATGLRPRLTVTFSEPTAAPDWSLYQ